MKTVWFMLFLLYSVIHLWACLSDNRRVRIFTKPMLVLCLLVFYVSIANPWNGWMVAALVLCWIGDVCLIPNSGPVLVLGGAGFLAGHLCFILAFFPQIRFETVPRGFLIAAGVLYAGASVIVVRRLLSLMQKKAVAAALLSYLLSHSVMNVLALALVWSRGNLSGALVYAGTLLFYVSDCILFFAFFGKEKPYPPLKRFLVMLTYLAGMTLIVLGMVP